MKLFRYCSYDEYHKFRTGELLENPTWHRPDCRGFCFFPFTTLEEAQRSLHQLTGIVTPEVLMILETDIPLHQTKGRYAKPLPKSYSFEDIFNPSYIEWKDEYCTTTYDKKNFKLLEAYKVDLVLFYENEAKAFTKLLLSGRLSTNPSPQKDYQ